MALIVAVGRSTEERNLGNFDSVEIMHGALRVAESDNVLAKHVHHRWIVQDQEPESFERLEITGPAFVIALNGGETRLGPYGHISIVNGVFYADRRVFGFVDVEQTDVYLGDLGQHCKGIRLTFNRRG